MKVWEVPKLRLYKCYYCICAICNLAYCPHGHDRRVRCWDYCVRVGRGVPVTDCDYFEHVNLRKAYRIKRTEQSGKRYTNAQLGAMLESVMLRLLIDVPEASGDYEILYCGAVVAVRKSYAEADEYARQFRNFEKVKIRKRVV